MLQLSSLQQPEPDLNIIGLFYISAKYVLTFFVVSCDLQMGYLEVVIPPDILSEESSEDGVALEGSNLQMKCKATGLPDPTVVWRREDSKNIILRADGSRDKQSKFKYFSLLKIVTHIMPYYII